jgi:hypothetical protein
MRLCDALEAKGQLEAAQHAQLVSTLLGTLTASATPEELADNWQRVAQHFDLLLDRPEAIDALEQTLLQLAVRGLLVPQDPTDEPASVLLQKSAPKKTASSPPARSNATNPCRPSPTRKSRLSCRWGGSGCSSQIPSPNNPASSPASPPCAACAPTCASALAERQSVQARLAEALVGVLPRRAARYPVALQTSFCALVLLKRWMAWFNRGELPCCCLRTSQVVCWRLLTAVPMCV